MQKNKFIVQGKLVLVLKQGLLLTCVGSKDNKTNYNKPKKCALVSSAESRVPKRERQIQISKITSYKKGIP